MNHLLSPVDFFGFEPASDRKMIHWNKLLSYYEHLAQNSSRVILNDEGPSTDGNRFISLVISSHENLKKLDEYCQMNKVLSDPQNHSQEEINHCIKNSKAFCMQVYSLHSNEVGGTQGCPGIIYDLITETYPAAKEILDNVIFVVVPCAEPDGEIIFTDWYNKYLGTKYEGCVSPYIRHRLAGHANNRDAFNLNVIESKYLIDMLARRYQPQCYQDHHHDCPNADRMSIAPIEGRLNPDYAPLLYREQSFYGSYMAEALEKAERTGICSGNENYDAYPSNTFCAAANAHNACGMLTESADALIATPIEIYPHQLIGKSHIDISIKCPSPWAGGKWHLSDIAKNQKIASLALLEAMALRREAVLENAYKKAIYQIEKGKNSKQNCYLISSAQYDQSACDRLLELMDFHGVKMFKTEEEFRSKESIFPSGSIIVPKAQPKYAVVEMFLGNGKIAEENRFAPYNRSSGANDGFYHCIYKNMGVKVIGINDNISIKTSVYNYAPKTKFEFPLSVKENISYKYVNELITKGKKVFYSKNGNFCIEEGNGYREIKRRNVGIFKRSDPNNEEEGFTQNLFEKFGFPHRTVLDKELRENLPTDIDTLIIPGDSPYILSMGDTLPDNLPIEHHKGLGSVGGKNLKAFVENGGRIFAFGLACDYVIDLFCLPITDLSRNLEKDKFNPCGTTVNIEIDNDDKLCYGLPESSTALINCAPAFDIKVWSWQETSGKWKIPISYSEDLIYNGVFKGSSLLQGKPALIRVPVGKGELILCSFSPAYRMQTDCTYKILFNALFD